MTVFRMSCLLIALAALPTLARGFQIDAEEMQALRTYCKADVERLCPNVQPGGGRIKACLMQQKKEISVGCAQALQKLKKQPS